MDVVPGQRWQRGLALLFGAGAVWLFVRRDAHGLPAAFLWISVVLFVMFALLAVPPLYRRWMAFAVWLNVWATRAIFSLIYLIVVPVVRVLYALSGRSRRDAGAGATLWMAKRAQDRTLEEMERMG